MSRCNCLALLFTLASARAFVQTSGIARARAIGQPDGWHSAKRLEKTQLLASKRADEMDKILFVEVGFGNDQHGQNPTKACVRACRNAIEFNSIPSIKSIVPGGYDNMKLRVQLAVPVPEDQVDVEAVKAAFPYGKLLPVEFQVGGMLASSGIEIPDMGDQGDNMIIAVCCVTVGY